ncbi:MAG: ABC transporter substrate-binding protein, partial [Alphaproteobacteria bacterium]
RQAGKLLDAAGWTVKNGARVNSAGEPLVFEILLGDTSNERITLAYQRNLKRLGVDAQVRVADSAQYAGRLEDFDFDMIVVRWRVSLSPGNEQFKFWSSEAAAAPGSRNYTGITNPALDAMIDTLVSAETREDLVIAARTLDRILMWGNYVVPLYHDTGFRIARWSKVARPEEVPIYGAVLETFWAEE